MKSLSRKNVFTVVAIIQFIVTCCVMGALKTAENNITSIQVNVNDFLLPNGVINVASLNSAILAARHSQNDLTTASVVLAFAKQEYILNASIIIENQNVTIRGEESKVTFVPQNDQLSALYFSTNDRAQTIEISDIELFSGSKGYSANLAIEIKCCPFNDEGSTIRSVYINNVKISSDAPTSQNQTGEGLWRAGVAIHYAYNAVIRDLTILGHLKGDGEFVCQYGLLLKHCIDARVDNLQENGVMKGVQLEEWGEGCVITSSKLLHVLYGVNIDPDANESWKRVHVDNTHISGNNDRTGCGIKAVRVKQSFFTNNLIYLGGDKSLGIQLGFCEDVQVTTNTFELTNGRTAVYQKACSNCIVKDNINP